MCSVFRVYALAGMFVAAVPAALDTAAAEPGICGNLRQQLASPSGNGRAAQQQVIELQQTRIRARQAGCTGVLFARGDPLQCARFERSIDRLSANVERLRNADSGSSPASRLRLLASLKANGCARERPRGLLEVLFGKRNPVEPAAPPRKLNIVRLQLAEPKKEPKRRSPDAPETLATTYEGIDPVIRTLVKKGYRTLCVRTCDGYYFPISFSTKPKNFARDQNACSSMCPAGNAKLYYHAVPGQESADMISVVSKVPYSELPNAFTYRTVGLSSVAGCSCHAAQSHIMSAAVVSNETFSDMIPARATALTLPAYAEIIGVSAEDKTAGIVTAKAGQSADPWATMTNERQMPETAEAKVRIVGPLFFPEQSEALDLQTAPPQNPRLEEEVSTRYTVDKIISTVAADIWRRIE